MVTRTYMYLVPASTSPAVLDVLTSHLFSNQHRLGIKTHETQKPKAAKKCILGIFGRSAKFPTIRTNTNVGRVSTFQCVWLGVKNGGEGERGEVRG